MLTHFEGLLNRSSRNENRREELFWGMKNGIQQFDIKQCFIFT